MHLQYKESKMKDIPVFPDQPQMKHLVYDPGQREYYNKRTDIFLSEDDISYHKLRPYSSITCPLPSPLPDNYFKEQEDDTTNATHD